VWQETREKIKEKNIVLKPKDLLLINKLADGSGCSGSDEQGLKWIDMIPHEWMEIYRALYEEAQYFNTSEREKDKIQN
jgi:hypothetical protein